MKPYKNDLYNYLDGLFSLYATLTFSLYMYANIVLFVIYYLDYYKISTIFLCVLFLLPALYLVGLIFHKVAGDRTKSWLQKASAKFASNMNNKQEDYQDLEELRENIGIED